MKKAVPLLVLAMVAVVLTGCFTVEQVVDLREPGGARLSAVLEVEQGYAGAEMDLFIGALHRAVPAIQRTSQYERVEDGSTVKYRWAGEERQPLENLPFTLEQLSDGAYSFEWTLEPVEGLSEETDSDSVLMRVVVMLPKEVDFANTLDIEGNTARWLLRKADLANGVRLRAITY